MRVALLACLCLAPGIAEAQDAKRVPRAYDIGFLSKPLPNPSEQPWPTAGQLVLRGMERSDREEGAAIAFTQEANESTTSELAPPGKSISAEDVVELIRKNVAEDSWANNLNSIEATGSSIRVVQTPAVHAEIAQLLAVLQARRALLVTVDIALVPVEALGKPADPESPWITTQEFEAVVARSGDKGKLVRLTAYNQQVVRSITGRHIALVADNEVNQTGVVPVVHPVVESIPLGVTVQAQPNAITGTSWFRVQVKVTQVEEAGPPNRRETFFGALDFQSLAERTLETTLLLSEDRAAIAGVVRAGKDVKGAEPFAVIARLRSTAIEPEKNPRADVKEPFPLRTYDVSFLVEPLQRFGDVEINKSDATLECAETPLWTPGILERLIRSNVEPDAWRDDRTALSVDGGGRLLRATANPATHNALKGYLDGLVHERARVATIEIEELEGTMADVLAVAGSVEAGTPLPGGGPREVENSKLSETSRTTLMGVLGAPMRVRAFESQRFIGDVSTVSGGTGFSNLSVPDPEVESAGSGIELSAMLRSAIGTGRLGIEFTFNHCLLSTERKASLLVEAQILPTKMDPAARRIATEDKGKPAPTGGLTPGSTWIPIELDLPAQSSTSVAGNRVLPEGRRAILRVESISGGRARLVSARVVSARAFGDAAAPPPSARAPGGPRQSRVFDLRSLDVTAATLGNLPSPPELRANVPGTELSELSGELQQSISLESRKSITPDDVAAVVGSLIEPDSWSNERNVLEAKGPRIVLTQGAEVLERVARFVAHVESIESRIVSVEAAIVPLSALEQAAPGSTKVGGSARLEGEVFDRALNAAGADAVLLGGSGSLGSPIRLLPGTRTRHLVDFEVNQTGVIPVANPVVADAREGAYGEAQVAILPGGGALRMEARIGRAFTSGVEQRSMIYGDVELLTRRYTEVSATTVVNSGQAVVLGLCVGPPGETKPEAPLRAPEAAVLLRVRLMGQVEAPDDEAKAAPRAIDIGALEIPDADFRRLETIPEGVLAALRNAVKSDEIQSRAVSAGTTLFFLGTKAERDSLAQELDQLARDRVHLHSIDLWQGAVPQAEAASLKGGAFVEKSWFDRMATAPGLRARITGVSGAALRLTSVERRAYIADLNIVSGGTESELRMFGDPDVAATGAGLVLDAESGTVPGAPWSQLRVEAEMARSPVFGKTSRVRTSTLVTRVNDGGKIEGAHVADWLTLDLPRESVDRLGHLVTVPFGTPVLLGLLPDEDAPGQSRVLMGVVHEQN